MDWRNAIDEPTLIMVIREMFYKAYARRNLQEIVLSLSYLYSYLNRISSPSKMRVSKMEWSSFFHFFHIFNS